jgi:hypothetical protein
VFSASRRRNWSCLVPPRKVPSRSVKRNFKNI